MVTSMKKAVKATSDSVEPKSWRDEKLLNNRSARPARNGFRIILVEVKYCLDKSMS